MGQVLAGVCVVIAALAVFMLVLVLVRSRAEVRRHQVQEGGDGSANIQAGRDFSAEDIERLQGYRAAGRVPRRRLRPGSPAIYDGLVRDADGERRDITSQGRTCCTTPPGTAHRGTCKNSQMRSGDPHFDVND